MKKLIIEHPEWQTPKRKYFIGFITLGFWMLWFYLWLPFISLIAWVFGIQVLEYHMIELKGYQGLLNLLANYAIVILLLSGSLFAWAIYNIRRFGTMDRRTPRTIVSTGTLAKRLKAPINDLERWQRSRLLEIEHGHIHAIGTIEGEEPLR